MDSKELWNRIFGFKVGDRVKVVNPNSSTLFGLKGTIRSIMRLKRFTLYEVEVETPTLVCWAVFRPDELELILDEE